MDSLFFIDMSTFVGYLVPMSSLYSCSTIQPIAGGEWGEWGLTPFLKVVVSSKVGDRSQRRPEAPLFNSYYTDEFGRALLLSLNCFTLPLIPT